MAVSVRSEFYVCVPHYGLDGFYIGARLNEPTSGNVKSFANGSKPLPKIMRVKDMEE